MANRKKPIVTPQLDKSPSDADGYTKAVELSESQFNCVARHLKSSGLDRVKHINDSCHEVLARVGSKVGRTAAVKGIPDGSDHFNGRSIIEWLGRIEKGNKAAIKQVAKLCATAKARLEG
jgi:hypothetical protein